METEAVELAYPHAFLRQYGFIGEVTVVEQDTIFIGSAAI
jgi:hypothetical protein